jgi:hypothetical protein
LSCSTTQQQQQQQQQQAHTRSHHQQALVAQQVRTKPEDLLLDSWGHELQRNTAADAHGHQVYPVEGT